MKRITRRRAAALAAAAPAALAGAVLATRAAAATHTVTIRNRRFRPETITIKAGDTVVWENNDGLEHTATAKDKSWSTKSLPGGASGAITFPQKGTYAYICKWHPTMRGKVVVT